MSGWLAVDVDPILYSADLTEGGEGRRRLETTWCTGQCAGSNLFGRI